MGNRIVDDLAHLGAILRVELAEQLFQVLSMILTLSEDNGFADKGTCLILDAIVDQIFKDDAIGIFAEDLAANIFACNGGIAGLFFAQVFFQLTLLFFCQVVVMNTITKKVGGQRSEEHTSELQSR